MFKMVGNFCSPVVLMVFDMAHNLMMKSNVLEHRPLAGHTVKLIGTMYFVTSRPN